MSLVSGYLITCERCGKTEFKQSTSDYIGLPWLGRSDSNSTSNRTLNVNEPDWVKYDKIGYLCKECSKKFYELLESFMNYEPGED